MSFLVTARKYRPSTFSEVVAQGHVVDTLLSSIRLDRIAHAYLFSGPRGVGKTTTARIFAKALNCPEAENGEPCNRCDTCLEITEGRSIDIIEIDGASNNGVEQVRTIRDSVRYTPSRGKYKMYVIDEVHMLSKPAFNALLKTLEEPPVHVIFILATTEPHKLPPTVLSRCQRYDFRRINIEDIVGQLRLVSEREGIESDEKALFTIARKGDGSMRDAESIFDQVVAFSGSELTYDAVKQVLHIVDIETYFEITNLIITKDSSGGFAAADDIVMSGYDIQDFLSGLEEHFRNLLVVRSTGETRLIEAPEDTRDRYMSVSEHFSEGDLLRLLKITSETVQAVKYSTQPRLRFEIALINMIKMDSTIEISRLLSSMQQSGTAKPTQGKQQQASRQPARTSPESMAKSVLRETSGPASGYGSHSTGTQGKLLSQDPRLPEKETKLPWKDSDPLMQAGDPLKQAEETYRAALRQSAVETTPHPAGNVVQNQHPAKDTSSGAERSSAPAAPQKENHPIVQMLIDGLDAVVLNQQPS